MAQTSMTVRLDNKQKAIFDELCAQFGMSANTAINIFVKAVIRSMAKTEHSHPLGMVVSTHFRCGKWVKRGLKNGALPFNID